MENILPYGKHYVDQDDIDAVIQVLKFQNLTQGEEVLKFENSVAEYVGVKHAVSVSSWTSGFKTGRQPKKIPAAFSSVNWALTSSMPIPNTSANCFSSSGSPSVNSFKTAFIKYTLLKRKPRKASRKIAASNKLRSLCKAKFHHEH